MLLAADRSGAKRRQLLFRVLPAEVPGRGRQSMERGREPRGDATCVWLAHLRRTRVHAFERHRLLGRLHRERRRPVAAHLTCVDASRGGGSDNNILESRDAGVTHVVRCAGDWPKAPIGTSQRRRIRWRLRRVADFEISVAAYSNS